DSLPTSPVAAHATAMDCGEIILPVTPPLELAATISTSLTPIWCAVVACNEPNSAFAEVSEPVRNTPSQPRNGEKNGKAAPVPANTSAKVDDMPEKLVTKAKASTMPMERIGHFSSTKVSFKVVRPLLMLIFRTIMEISAERKIRS